jgi:hypothetical protein
MFFFKDGAISSGASEVKEAAGRYFCWGEAHSWVYQTSWELQIVSMITENSGLYSFDSEFWGGGGGGALKILKTWRGASKIYQ